MIEQQAVKPDVSVEPLIETAIKLEKSSIQRSERKHSISSSDSELSLHEKNMSKKLVNSEEITKKKIYKYLDEIDQIDIASGRSEPIKNHNKFEHDQRQKWNNNNHNGNNKQGFNKHGQNIYGGRKQLHHKRNFHYNDRENSAKKISQKPSETQTDNKIGKYRNQRSKREQLTRRTENRIRSIKY